MTPSQAARVIGCSAAHVRRLCAAGTIRATPRRLLEYFFTYDIPRSEAERIRDNPPKPRGVRRGSKSKKLG